MNASVFLDGKFLGHTSTNRQIFPNITAGEHIVEIHGSADKGIHHEFLRFEPGQVALIDASLPDRSTVVAYQPLQSRKGLPYI